MKISLIIGLPGSGKTSYAKTLEGYLIDDMVCYGELPAKVDYLIITSPFFCRQNDLDLAINHLLKYYPGCEIEKIYFENNIAQCLKNSKLRENKQVQQFTYQLSKNYVVDTSCKVLPCWKQKD